MNLSGSVEMRVDVESVEREDHDVLAIPRSANPRGSSLSGYSRNRPSHSGASGRLSYQKTKNSKNRFVPGSSSRTPTPYSDSDNADSDNYSNRSDEDSNFFSRSRSGSKKEDPLGLGTYYETSPNNSSRLHDNLPYANNVLTNSLSEATPIKNYPNQIKTNAFINYNVNPDDPDEELSLNPNLQPQSQPQGANANSKSATVKTNGVNHNGIGFYSKFMPTPSKIHNNSDLYHETDLNAIVSIPTSTPTKEHYVRNGKLPNQSSVTKTKNQNQSTDDYVDFFDTRYPYGVSNGIISTDPDSHENKLQNHTGAHSSSRKINRKPSFTAKDTNNMNGKKNSDKNGGSGNSHNGRGNSTGKNKKAISASKPLPSNLEPPAQWKLRLKMSVTFVSALMLIFSCSSLLFIFPIIVDPIVFGLQAQFSAEPAQCKTVSYRNETGTGNCTEPSCREGCTVDLYSCFFIIVEYQLGFYEDIPSTGNFSDLNASSISPFLDANNLTKKYFKPTNDEIKVATLRVNPNGCGYPPDVICSEFNRSFGERDTIFPCYYSHLPIANESIAVVPFYNRETEIMHLSVALGIPLAVVLVSAGLLFITVRWHPRAQRRKQRKKSKKSSNEEFDNVPDLPGSSSSSDAILQPRKSSGLNHNHNGFIPKANGHIENTVSGLMGFNSMQLSGQPDSIRLYEKNLSTVPSSSTGNGNRNGKIKT